MEESVLVFETKNWNVFLNQNQGYLGYCVVVLKRQARTVSEITSEEWNDLHEVIRKTESGIRKAFNATMFNWACFMNNAYTKSPPNPWVHWHVKPRYNKSVNFEGEIFEDKEFGKPFDWYKKNMVSKELLEKIAAKINNNF